MSISERTTGRNGWPDVSDAVRRTMRANKSKDTGPEKNLRSLVHAMGYRFSTHSSGLPGKPDLTFTARRKAIWMHGCFWHSHVGCKFAKVPRTRSDYWVPKLARNRQRDTENVKRLHEMGWETAVVWECELRDPGTITTRLRAFLGPQRIVAARPRRRGECAITGEAK